MMGKYLWRERRVIVQVAEIILAFMNPFWRALFPVAFPVCFFKYLHISAFRDFLSCIHWILGKARVKTDVQSTLEHMGVAQVTRPCK